MHVTGRSPHTRGQRRPGRQHRHRDQLRGSWLWPARRADRRLPAYDELVLARAIPCAPSASRLLPFSGVAHVGYLPGVVPIRLSGPLAEWAPGPDLDVSVRSIRRRSSAPCSRQARAIGRRRRSARITSSRRVRLPDRGLGRGRLPRGGTWADCGRDVTSNRRREQWPRAVTMT
jgi:hypothetical protein